MISIILVMFVVGVVLKIILEEKYSYTDDIEQFKIFSGKNMPMVFDVSAILWFAISVAASFTGNPRDKYMWVAFFFVGLLSVICSIAIRKKITISGNDIVYKALFPYKNKHYTFGEIDHIETLDGGTVIVMGKSGKLFSFDMDFLGSDNFIKRCEKEGKKITSKGGKTLTKKDFLKSKVTLWLMVIFSILAVAFSLPTALVNGKIMDVVEFVLVLGVGIPAVAYILMVPKTYFLINAMEKTLNIDFNKEMADSKIGKTPYMDENWFIASTVGIQKFVMNRKFVKEIVYIGEGESGYMYLTIRTIDNKKRRFYLSNADVSEFSEWFRGHLPIKK